MEGGIFVSYRREDAAASAGRLCDHLLRHFPREKIFFDVDNIEPGLDFVKVLDDSVANCEVLLAVIGKGWVSAKLDGRSRLASPTDFVRIELESALKREIRVVPVLVDGATMPTERQLPKGLKSLARRQAVTVSHASFAADTERLINVLRRHFEAIALPAESRKPIVAPPASAPEALVEITSSDLLDPAPDSEAMPDDDDAPGEDAFDDVEAPEPESVGPFSAALAQAEPEPGDELPPKTLGQILAERAVANAPQLIHPLERSVAQAFVEEPKPAPPKVAAPVAAKPYSTATSWLAALLFPLTVAIFTGYILLDIPAFTDSNSASRDQAISATVAAAIPVVILFLIVRMRARRGAPPEPTLFFASAGWSAGALFGLFLTFTLVSGPQGPWPFYLMGIVLVAGYSIGLMRGAFARGGRGLLIYFACFTPLAASLVPVWTEIRRGFDQTPQDPASYLTLAYLVAYFVPYLLMVTLPRPATP